MWRKFLLAGSAIALASAVLTTQAAAQRHCLRNDNILRWEAPDDTTLIVTDRQSNRFMVRLDGNCSGIRPILFRMSFRTAGNRVCLRPGHEVRFEQPGWGRESCFVRTVQRIERYDYDND
jgi:hypothetical protein